MSDLYVLPVEGQPVQRYGTRVLIGASRDPKEPRKITWDVERVVMIPAAEFQKYRREYRRALANGSLKVTTAQEYRKQQAPPPPPAEEKPAAAGRKKK